MANGYVRYGNSIHLDGFQILDFCIENAISLESLSDRNLGRKVFLTGNDTNEGYLRENVWDGSKWRAAAYLDDLTSFKDEDFNKLKEKVDTLIGDGVDMDGIIESWKEVEAFLKGISDTKDLVTLLDGKLNKTGGTISNDQWANQLILNHNTSGEPAGLRFHSNDELMGIIYVNYQHRLMFHNGTIPNLEVLHSGNAGDYTAGAAKKLAPFYGSIMRPTSADVEPINDGSMYTFMATSSMTVGKPITDGFILNFEWDNSDYISQLFLGNGSVAANNPNRRMQARFHTPNGWSDWKTIAFTDSDITGNAATATKLAKEVTLWGNTFDGTQSLNGNIHMPSGSALYFITTNQEYIAAVNMASDNVLTFGNGTNFSARNLNTRVDGYNIYFRTGAKQTAMTITEEGNVQVGSSFIPVTLPAPKMSVHGGLLCVQAIGSELSLNSLPERGLVLGGNGHTLSQYLENSGNFSIQAHYIGDGTTRALNLNPLGGAVNIASADASTHVLGTMVAHGYVGIGITYPQYMLEVLGDLCVNRGNHGSNNTTFRINCADNKVNLYAEDLDDAVCNLCFYVEGKEGMRINSVGSVLMGLGYDNGSGAKLQVVGNATFSNRVLIGGAEDDADYALITKGNWKLTSTDKGDYFSIKLRDVNVDYYGYDAADSWCNHNFISNGTTRFFVAGSDAEWSYIKGKFRAYGEFRAEELATFNGGALIPTGQKLTIGSVTFEEDADGRVKVDGDMYTTGTLASGGKAKEGTGTGSGSANVRDFELPANGQTTYDCEHMLNTKNVIVQVFEKAMQNHIEVWEMILTDVAIVTENKVTVTFGRGTNRIHKVHIIGGNPS